MIIEEWVQQSREEKRELFGEIGLHDDCLHYGTLNGKPFCNACEFWNDHRRHSRKDQILQCEKRMCYFYKPKGKDDGND